MCFAGFKEKRCCRFFKIGGEGECIHIQADTYDHIVNGIHLRADFCQNTCKLFTSKEYVVGPFNPDIKSGSRMQGFGHSYRCHKRYLWGFSGGNGRPQDERDVDSLSKG